jgi:formylglycine-generating enzyme required for sulfatase activity
VPGIFLIASGCIRLEPPIESCPPDMVLLPRDELTIGETPPTQAWHEAGRAAAVGPVCIDRYEFPNVIGDLPKVFVGWQEARELCAARGRRLCSSDEWERACRGAQHRLYSYGATFDPDRCNTPIGGSAPDPSRDIPFTRAGEKAECRSPEGVFDLDGNVSEWVADPWTGPRMRHAGVDESGDWRSLRGGTMWNETVYGQDCTSRHGHPIIAEHADDGFRCCMDPPR